MYMYRERESGIEKEGERGWEKEGSDWEGGETV